MRKRDELPTPHTFIVAELSANHLGGFDRAVALIHAAKDERRRPQMKDSACYAKVVEWSTQDECYVGSAPGLILGGCHGLDEKEVFAELCDIVDEAIALYRADGKPLPPPIVWRDCVDGIRRIA